MAEKLSESQINELASKIFYLHQNPTRALMACGLIVPVTIICIGLYLYWFESGQRPGS